MNKYIANTRIVKGSNTGISRFVSNLLPYLQDVVIEESPKNKLFYAGILGHVWDILAFIKYRNRNVWLTSHRGSPFLNKYFITIHDLQPILSRKSFTFFYYFYYRLFIGLHIRKSKHVFTVSEKVKLDIINLFNIQPDDITVTYPGYEHLLAYDISTCFVPPNFKYAIMYGNISEVKNSLPNINAWITVNSLNTLRLVIIGNLDKSIEYEFNQLLIKHNKIIYLRFIDDTLLFNYLKNSSYLFFNSPNEGFGIPALEAVYFRIPVLYAANSSVSEFISNYGVPVEQGNYQSLCDGLRNILHVNVNVAEYENIRSLVLHKCSWANTAKLIAYKFNNY